MADTTQVATSAAETPSASDIERVHEFSHEPILVNDEGPEALVPGSARRLALDDALREIASGAEEPSPQWRRQHSLMLGLERLLVDETPRLADGAELSPHQVDALSGTLAALVTELEAPSPAGGGNGTELRRGNGAGPNGRESIDGGGELDADDSLGEGEEPVDWGADDEGEQIEAVPEDPGASRRFWFEHAANLPRLIGLKSPLSTFLPSRPSACPPR